VELKVPEEFTVCCVHVLCFFSLSFEWYSAATCSFVIVLYWK